MPATLADIQKKYGESVYPLYKDETHEPYMENDNGIGYKGVVMYDELIDKIQCSICDGWYDNLSAHIFHGHGIQDEKYREDYGLPKTIPLCSIGNSMRISKKTKEMATKKNSKWGGKKGMRWSDETLKKRAVAVKKGKNTIWYKNKFGLCDAQIAARLIVVMKMAGKNNMYDLRSKDIQMFDPKLEWGLRSKYGNMKKAYETIGIKVIKIGEYNDAKLLAVLRSFVRKHCRLPVWKDCKTRDGELPSLTTFTKYFGSWRRAKMMAGLDQLLEEVKIK
jgi:hypothetical protein